MPVRQSGIVPPIDDRKVRASRLEIKDKIQEIRTKQRITARQCRGARGLLDMSQRDLAAASGVHLQTLLDFEKGHRSPRSPTMQAIIRALEDAGIVFIPANGGGQGVRLRDPDHDARSAQDSTADERGTESEAHHDV